MMERDEFNRMIELLEEIRIYTKFGGFRNLYDLIEKTLTKKVEQLVYEESNGLQSARMISKKLGISHMTVVSLWRKWRSLGIVEEIPDRKGRYSHIIPLRCLGIIVKKPVVK